MRHAPEVVPADMLCHALNAIIANVYHGRIVYIFHFLLIYKSLRALRP